MGIQFKRSESTGAGVRRVASELVTAAIEGVERLASGETALDSPQGASLIHETRKRCKELRALARLVRPGLGPSYRHTNRAARDAARELGGVRDAQAQAATFRRLVRADPTPGLARATAPVAVLLTERSLAAGRDVDVDLRRAAILLAGIRNDIDGWDLPGGFDLLAEGLRETYSRGLRGLRGAERHRGPLLLHEWRKSVKYLWHQNQMLQRSAPSLLGPTADLLHRLADTLGDDHDLVGIGELLRSSEAEVLPEAALVSSLVAIGVRRCDLRRRVLSVGSRLYVEEPEAYLARMEGYWRAWHEHGAEVPVGGIGDLPPG
ncbi:MAG TPA: CHAD domain-containing protein [Acidimicrobiales bacterium]|nr:CHAD domain-containing protein [Acidimicrobiales bacterium]